MTKNKEKKTFNILQLVIMYILAILKDFLDGFGISLTTNPYSVAGFVIVGIFERFISGLKDILGETSFFGILDKVDGFAESLIYGYVAVFLIGSLLVFLIMPIFIGIILGNGVKLSVLSWIIFSFVFFFEIIPFLNLIPATTYLVLYLSRQTLLKKTGGALGGLKKSSIMKT